jgi:Golgi phosphoprotein 3 (GPP34)
MARISESLLLLLLDNAAARPALDDSRRQRALAAALLLDLAYTCRMRLADAGDPVPEGRLMVVTDSGPRDAALEPALKLLSHKPITTAQAISKLRRTVEPHLLEHLQTGGHIERVRLYAKGLRRQDAWTLTDRGRPAAMRAEMLSVLVDDRRPEPYMAAIISLLHSVDGLRALLSLDERSWQWVDDRAAEIASGGWVDEYVGWAPEVNLVVTAAAVRSALA